MVAFIVEVDGAFYCTQGEVAGPRHPSQPQEVAGSDDPSSDDPSEAELSVYAPAYPYLGPFVFVEIILLGFPVARQYQASQAFGGLG